MESDRVDDVQLRSTKLDHRSPRRRRAVAITNVAVIGIATLAVILQGAPERDVELATSSLESTAPPPTTTIASPVDTDVWFAESTLTVESLAPTTDELGDASDPTLDTPAPTHTAEPTTTVRQLVQDVYGDICVNQGWVNCAEYVIFDAYGEQQNRVIANSDWSLAEIALLSGGGVDGSAVKVRDIYPCPPSECYSATSAPASGT